MKSGSPPRAYHRCELFLILNIKEAFLKSVCGVQGQHVPVPHHIRGHLSMSLQHLWVKPDPIERTDISWFNLDSIDDRELHIMQLFKRYRIYLPF